MNRIDIPSKAPLRPKSIASRNSSWHFGTLTAVCALLFASAAWPVPAAQDDKFPKASEIVKPQVNAPAGPVARGQAFSVSVSAEIRKGFHIQANKVREDYLIPTTLEAQLPAGVKLLDTSYPKARLVKFSFNPKEMAVYEGKIELKLKLEADSAASQGKFTLPLTLRYQACSDAACLPPVRLPLTATIDIAPAG